MKLKFKQQDYQTDAVNAVADLFAGQERTHSAFSVESGGEDNLFGDLGFGNALRISDKALAENMRQIQRRNALPATDDEAPRQFCVEMETGTGKTYVYTKTIFELHRRFGFTKFVVVVPSVAIREGVFKSFQVTEEHFALQYDNVPCRFFIYNSAKLSDVRRFATSTNIEIMIINIDAFKKAENVINQAQDRLGGDTAIRFIQATRPIVIIDEPQSVDNTPKAKEAIASLHPLCVLRYSATHREKMNLLYRLTPVDAYQMGLVKQISVFSHEVAGGFNQPYVRLLSVSHGKGFRAKIEIDIRGKTGTVRRKSVTVKQGDDLFLISGGRGLYEGYEVSGIDCTPEREHIEFTNTEEVALGEAIGDVDENIVKRAQIFRTIETHLNKELLYMGMGIKVLSLFFIDRVEKYRREDGAPGVYARMFEECYAELIARPKYAPIRDRFSPDVSKAHDGYFSRDKRGHLKDTKGDTQADDTTYNTIMRDKEWLLSFACPLRFIFSHSALKEGWDNPNVFQVCTLVEQKSAFTCRQKVGRGLRLCVNQDGEQIADRNINVLHVMANESFAEFASALQKEIEDDTGMRFGVLQLSMFAGIVYAEKREEARTVTREQAEQVVEELTTAGIIDESGALTAPVSETENVALSPKLEEVRDVVAAALDAGGVAPEALTGKAYIRAVEEEKTLTPDDAQALMTHFEKKGYITDGGRIKDTMRDALRTGTLDLPKKYEAARSHLEAAITGAERRPPIRDASRDVVVRLKEQVMGSDEFKELWSKIQQKTTYRVQIDERRLHDDCVKALREMPPIPRARLVSRTADIHIENAGVRHTERSLQTTDIADTYSALPDILTAIRDKTMLSLSTLAEILIDSGRTGDFLNDPEAFLQKATAIIRECRHKLAIEGIRYVRLNGQEYDKKEIFAAPQLLANLDRNAVKVNRSVYDYLVYDSATVEKPFALALDKDPDVKMFLKLPRCFTIDTPIGTYTPDWAVYLTRDSREEKLYFIFETKGSESPQDLRERELQKFRCGERHFQALDSGVQMHLATDWTEIKKRI